jgi:cobalt-zinc-cadmium efflux system membrane fusion protein
MNYGRFDQGSGATELGSTQADGKQTFRRHLRQAGLLLLVALAGALYLLWPRSNPVAERREAASASRSAETRAFSPTPEQWANLTIRTVEARPFQSKLVTEGKIAIDEDHATPIFSPYSGRVTRILVKPGDMVERGELLFALEATDMVQAQNDFIAAVAALETAQSQLNLAQIIEKRQHDLYDAKAVPLKDWQQSQNDLTAAQNNTRSAEIALEAVRNRLRILQKTEQEISDFQRTGKINPETPIYSPIAGTVVQRKVGPGQFITSGASDPAGDPVFVIGDLKTVWLVANVRESDALAVHPGQKVQFRMLASRGRLYESKLDYVASSIDPATRRLQVRATVDNADRSLKPEMFSTVDVFTGVETTSPAVPREAVLYEGDRARVWIARGETSLELRDIETGLANGNLVQVLSGIAPGERIVVRGSIFIDRAATENRL